jgi:hypothetical protein
MPSGIDGTLFIDCGTMDAARCSAGDRRAACTDRPVSRDSISDRRSGTGCFWLGGTSFLPKHMVTLPMPLPTLLLAALLGGGRFANFPFCWQECGVDYNGPVSAPNVRAP